MSKSEIAIARPADSAVAEGVRPSALAAAFAWVSSGWGLAVLALGGCWLLLFDSLRGEWELNAQYNYGFVVPFLGAALFWRRWQDRPTSAAPGNHVPVLVIGSFLMLWVLPLRLILEANPEWRLAYWIQALQVVGLTGCLLYYRGGWSWVRHFGFPICFTLIAVPWPMEQEQSVIQGLTRFVAGATVEFAGWLGIPAMQHGNLIEIGNGMVGIDEACSGVRSLQSGLMIALFLGEQYRFAPTRRLVLLVSSIALVILANMGRTTFLVWAAVERGFHQMEAWHDTAGNVVMWIVLPGLFLLAWLLRPRAIPSTASSRAIGHPRPFPRWLGITAMILMMASIAVAEMWYRTHESKLIPNHPWALSWPVDALAFKESQVPEKALAILRCNNSQTATWQDDAGNQWSVFLLRWDAGENSAQLAKGHRPEICLTAAGARLLDDLGMVAISMGDVQLNFHHLTFEGGRELMHVFYCIWEDKVSPVESGLSEDGSRSSRLDAVVAGKRNLGQQVLEIVLTGPEAKEEARQVLESSLPSLIKVL